MKGEFKMKKVLISMMSIAVAAITCFTAYAESVWNGGVDTDWATDANGNYLITSADELAGLAQKVNSGTSYSGYTFLLMDDLNLNGSSHNWNTIGYFNGVPGGAIVNSRNPFSGTFDGQGHTISNYSASYNAGSGTGRITVGLFGYTTGATIKNLVVTNSYVSVKSNAYHIYGGAIVGFMDGGSVVTNCTSTNNSINVNAPFQVGVKYGNAYAGGIAGSAENSTASDCSVAGNSLSADGAKSDNSANISNNYGGSSVADANNNVYSSTTEMAANIAEINRATILYNNLGIGSAPKTPYYLDETTGMPTDKIYYALLGVDNSQAEAGSVRNNAAIIHNANKMDFEYNSTTYALYPAGATVVAEFYLEGYTGDWTNAGYYIAEITDNNGNVLATSNDATYIMPETGMDEEGNPTFSFESGRFLRKQQFTIAMPAAATTLYYTTEAVIPSSVESVEAATRIYGANGVAVVEAAGDSNVTVVDMAGRVVYNGKVSQGRNELTLDRGFYIVNGTKVVVR